MTSHVPFTGRSADALLTPREVCEALRVEPRTLVRWADAGKLETIRTIGGHRRYRRVEVEAIMRGGAK